jgi:UDP-N-acetylmuramate dehydrogenase
MRIEENKLLAPYTSFGIGGAARWFAEAKSEEEIAEAAAWAREHGAALFVLGGGSNLLVADAGFNGLVLRVGLRGIVVDQVVDKEDSAKRFAEKHTSEAKAVVNFDSKEVRAKALTYRAAAGEDWEYFVRRATEDDCAGIECLAGIPGTVGGTPVQNVGAYGQEAASAIERVRAFDLKEHAFVEFPAAECGFAYRRSRFNSEDRGRYVVTRVDYRLTPGGAATVCYAELQRALAEATVEGREANLAEVAEAVRRLRQSKGMLMVEGDAECRSAGSFFKNPVVSDEDFQRIAAKNTTPPPRFPAGAGSESLGRVKIPAAWLIEQAGFAKGYTRGGAAISSRHALALVNRGNATAQEILLLAEEIRGAVEERFQIRLEIEPVLLGI